MAVRPDNAVGGTRPAVDHRGGAPGQLSDLGLFGPETIAWRMHRSPALLLGGLRALMVQALHPLAMAAVAQFSDYRHDVWGRYHSTSEYVLTTVFGTSVQAREAGARVRAVHAPIAGVDGVTGEPFRADDPMLLLWVHLALVESFTLAYDRYVRPLARTERDQYVAEMVRQAELVGLDARRVPATWEGVEASIHERRRHLLVSPDTRDALHVILRPPLPWWQGAGWRAIAEGAVALLPDYALELYCIPRRPVRWAVSRPLIRAGTALTRWRGRPPPVVRDADLRAKAAGYPTR